MPNKDRGFHEAPEKAGGEGWLYSEQQKKLCHFRPDTATVHAQVDRHKDLRLRSASFACADDSQADAQAQRY